MALQSDESRNKELTAFADPVTGSQIFDSRAPFAFIDRADNLPHRAQQGDTWWSIAARYYYWISDRPAGLWWVVMGYQPTPVVDPTLELRPSTLIIVPHPAVVITEILGADRSTFQ